MEIVQEIALTMSTASRRCASLKEARSSVEVNWLKTMTLADGL